MATTASGKGVVLGMGDWVDDDLITDVETPTPGAAPVVNDWWWTGAPDPTLIPWTWLSVPLSLRLDQPINSATIDTATSTNASSVARYGVYAASGTSSASLAVDPANYATYLVTYYADPLLRCPTWTFDLAGVQFQDPENLWRILGRELGDRVTLTDALVTDPGGAVITIPIPAGLPAAARSLVIEGIGYSSGPATRLVTFTTAPVIGTTWFRPNYSRLDGTDLLPF